jgi:RNA polymerase sigma-70 factor (ECF subfamily)
MLRAWLFGIARRVAASTRRKRNQQIPTERSQAVGRGASPESEVAARELLLQLLETVDEDQRVAFMLHDLEGFSGAEIAEMLEVPRGTVYSRIRLARKQLAAQVRRLRLRRAV